MIQCGQSGIAKNFAEYKVSETDFGVEIRVPKVRLNICDLKVRIESCQNIFL